MSLEQAKVAGHRLLSECRYHYHELAQHLTDTLINILPSHPLLILVVDTLPKIKAESPASPLYASIPKLFLAYATEIIAHKKTQGCSLRSYNSLETHLATEIAQTGYALGAFNYHVIHSSLDLLSKTKFKPSVPKSEPVLNDRIDTRFDWLNFLLAAKEHGKTEDLLQITNDFNTMYQGALKDIASLKNPAEKLRFTAKLLDLNDDQNYGVFAAIKQAVPAAIAYLPPNAHELYFVYGSYRQEDKISFERRVRYHAYSTDLHAIVEAIDLLHKHHQTEAAITLGSRLDYYLLEPSLVYFLNTTLSSAIISWTNHPLANKKLSANYLSGVWQYLPQMDESQKELVLQQLAITAGRRKDWGEAAHAVGYLQTSAIMNRTLAYLVQTTTSLAEFETVLHLKSRADIRQAIQSKPARKHSSQMPPITTSDRIAKDTWNRALLSGAARSPQATRLFAHWKIRQILSEQSQTPYYYGTSTMFDRNLATYVNMIFKNPAEYKHLLDLTLTRIVALMQSPPPDSEYDPAEIHAQAFLSLAKLKWAAQKDSYLAKQIETHLGRTTPRSPSDTPETHH